MKFRATNKTYKWFDWIWCLRRCYVLWKLFHSYEPTGKSGLKHLQIYSLQSSEWIQNTYTVRNPTSHVFESNAWHMEPLLLAITSWSRRVCLVYICNYINRDTTIILLYHRFIQPLVYCFQRDTTTEIKLAPHADNQ